MQNTTNFVKKIILVLFVIELIGLLFGYFLGSSTSIPALNKLASMINSTNATSQNLAGAFSFQLIPIDNSASASGWFGTDWMQLIANGFFAIINFVASVIDFLIQVLILALTGIEVMIFVVTVLLPSILTGANLGIFGFIFELGYGLLGLLFGIFIFDYIIRLVSIVLGGVR